METTPLNEKDYIKPIKTSDTNVTFAENQKEYEPLPAHRISNDVFGRLVITFGLTWYQRILLLITGKIFFSIQTFNKPVQPVSMSVKNILSDIYFPYDIITAKFDGMLYTCKLKIGTPVIVLGLPMVVTGFFGWDGVIVKDEKGTEFRPHKHQLGISYEAALETSIKAVVCD